MKPATLLLVSAALFSSAALAQSSRDSDRRTDRYSDTPQFIEPSDGEYNRHQNRNRNRNQNYGNQYGTPTPSRPGDANPYATTPGAPNPWATVPGTPPNSQQINQGHGHDRPGSASSGSTVKAAPSPGGGLLPEDKRLGSGDGGTPRKR